MTILRLCVWLVPGFILTVGLLLALRMAMPWRFAFPLILCVFFAIGYFDMRLKLQIERVDPKPMKRSVLGWALAFAFIQIIIAPAVAMALIYGYLMVTDNGFYIP